MDKETTIEIESVVENVMPQPTPELAEIEFQLSYLSFMPNAISLGQDSFRRGRLHLDQKSISHVMLCGETIHWHYFLPSKLRDITNKEGYLLHDLENIKDFEYFDCSALVVMLTWEIDPIEVLKIENRFDFIEKNTSVISPEEVQFGDIVTFYEETNNKNRIHHWAIYFGNFNGEILILTKNGGLNGAGLLEPVSLRKFNDVFQRYSWGKSLKVEFRRKIID